MVGIPYDDRNGFIWMDGEMLPWREAKVHFLTHGLHYASSVFEGERLYNGKIFKSVEHSERLLNSAKIIHMPMDISVETLEAVKYDVVKANNLTDGYVRAAAWRGAEQMGIDVSGSRTHVAVAAWDWGKYFFSDGETHAISLMPSRWAKPAPHTAPTDSKCAGLYALSSMAKKEAMDKGYTDALMLDHEGFVAESTGANLFAVKDGGLITPIADRFLNGITRQTIIGLAKQRGIEVVERRIKPEELSGFDGIFLTGTAAEITPVNKIGEDLRYEIDPVITQLHKDYEDLTH